MTATARRRGWAVAAAVLTVLPATARAGDRPAPSAAPLAASLAASLAAGPATSAEAEDAYAAAGQRLRAADAAVVRGRQQAVLAYRAAPAYAASAAAVAAAYDAFAQRRNGLLTFAERHDPRYATLKKGAADVDAEIARGGPPPPAGSPPAPPPLPVAPPSADVMADLVNQRAGLLKQLQALEDDAVDRDADAHHLRQQWVDASARLRDLQDRQAAAVEATGTVRSAVATAAAARSAADAARAAVPGSDPAEPSAGDLARRYPRHGLSWNDAWLTDGDGEGGQ